MAENKPREIEKPVETACLKITPKWIWITIALLILMAAQSFIFMLTENLPWYYRFGFALSMFINLIAAATFYLLKQSPIHKTD